MASDSFFADTRLSYDSTYNLITGSVAPKTEVGATVTFMTLSIGSLPASSETSRKARAWISGLFKPNFQTNSIPLFADGAPVNRRFFVEVDTGFGESAGWPI